jgi:hypothetical protein
MVESRGEKKLRLVKETQARELRQRTAARISELRVLSTGVATDIEERRTQCNDWSPCLNACLFCLLFVVANLLFIQWAFTKGFLRFEKTCMLQYLDESEKALAFKQALYNLEGWEISGVEYTVSPGGL